MKRQGVEDRKWKQRKREENVKRTGKDKAIEKVEKRDRCASCAGGLMDLFYEWIFIERR